jgi:hypothetical protein
MILKHKVAIALALAAVGYIGAAVFYSYLLGLSISFPYLCPACPNIDSFGSPLWKFVARTVSLGTINAVLFATVGWTVIALAAGFRRLISR